MTNILSKDTTISNIQLLRLFTKYSTFDWTDTIIDLANSCPELIELDKNMGGGFLPKRGTPLNKLQKDFIVIFSHIEDFTPELLESLISVFIIHGQFL